MTRRRSSATRPDLLDIERQLVRTAQQFEQAATGGALDESVLATLGTGTRDLTACDEALRRVPGIESLLADRVGLARLELHAAELQRTVDALHEVVDSALGSSTGPDVETVNAAMIEVTDVAWSIVRDRLPAARRIDRLAGGSLGTSAVEAYSSIDLVLSSIDRLEVRGRDSAGVQVLVSRHLLDLGDPVIAELFRPRAEDALFTSMAVRATDSSLAFVYKTAAEVGELGDNTAKLRHQIERDELLRLALGGDDASAVVLGHTRWASVGIISEPNAHPLCHEELGSASSGPFVVAALNGDVDNYSDLAALEALDLPAEITTDAKVIPTLVSRRVATTGDSLESFRSTVASFEGSVAIAAQAASEPRRLLLAQRGSGQALYVGLDEDTFCVASEPYGLVEAATRYLRLDGETPRQPENPASAGQIVVLDGERAGELSGITRISYDGASLPVVESELQEPEITTRDVDRGDHPHYLLKEITEAPESFRKTLRGRIADRGGVLHVDLPDESLPEHVKDRLRSGEIRRVIAIGQGTAAVAGQSLAVALDDFVDDHLQVQALPATELSGFGVTESMRDTLVVAFSQSGTTTDTNRTVDVVRARGGAVISIVNRRQSDLVDKSDGVLYTSDGRDVEMSVASTKAFYAQVAAGLLLSLALADLLVPNRESDDRQHDRILRALRSLPDAMRSVIGDRSVIGQAAARHAPSRRSWAVVGNGLNRIAALEVRIKLSELCYKSIACDVTEDKKHIDLSAEALVLVCAAGLTGSNADDVAKEVAIYRAHKGAPIVIATESDDRFAGATDVIPVPAMHPRLAFVLSSVAGHLFAYEAALAIDASARPLREARGTIERLVAGQSEGEDLHAPLARELAEPARAFFDGLRSGGYDGSLEARTAVRLASLLRYASGMVALEAYQTEFGKVGTPGTLIEDLMSALTVAIEELTRPVDAIRHQAKTVTVGISRSDEILLRVGLVQSVLATGVARDNLSYRTLRNLATLDEAVDEVLGYTRYAIHGDVDADAVAHVVEKGGIATGIRSRIEDEPRLKGTKHRAATEREVTVVRGRADGRTIVLVPEVKGTQTIGLSLLHVRFHDRVEPDVARRILSGYRGRYEAIHDAVTETEPTLRDSVLAEIPLVDLLSEPVYVLAEHWRSS